MMNTKSILRNCTCCLALLMALVGQAANAASESQLDNTAKPYLAGDDLVRRAAPLLEFGDPFLETGNLKPGFTLPGGAIWQPRLWVYGSARSSVQTWRNPDGSEQSEWVNRMDLFANLQLSGTERILLGVQPLHRDREFTGRNFDPDVTTEMYNDRIRTLFFEGDFAELFPWLDPNDSTSNDIGFSVGRQPLFYQDGTIINDQLDAFGISRNNLRFQSAPWLSSLRITAVFAWGDVHRGDNQENDDSELLGVFAQWDTRRSTINTDFVFVRGDSQLSDDLWVGGIDAIQRIGLVNTTFRVNGSHAPDQRSAQADNGVLAFAEMSWSPAHTENNAYINGFIGFDRFRSAARDPLAGGPLGRTGILFAARGLGDYPSALANSADNAYGFAAGYQMFFANKRRQLLVEAGAHKADNADHTIGVAMRLQQAIGRRFILLLDGYGASNMNLSDSYGASIELLVKF